MAVKTKSAARSRRHTRLRKKVVGTELRPRLVVTRSARHVFVQVVDDSKGHTLASASTMEDGMRSFSGDKTAMTEAEAVAAMDQLDKTMRAAQAKAGQDFLAANAKKPGVKVTASGLQYRVLKAGSGTSPGDTSTVSVHYHGTFIDGQVFDSSVRRGQPATFPVNGVISGWTEALKLMKPGDKWQLVIPSNLAFVSVSAKARMCVLPNLMARLTARRTLPMIHLSS